MNPTPPTNDGWGLAMWAILGLIGMMGVLGTTCGVLFRQILALQKEKDKQMAETQESIKVLTSEFSALMGQVSERMRVGNELMVKVKEVIERCPNSSP